MWERQGVPINPEGEHIGRVQEKNPFQVPTNMSIGASARPNSKEPAIIMPGEISWLSAR